MKEYQAYAGDYRTSANSAKQAAKQFFAQFPAKRKCNVIEGKREGAFFTVTYGRKSTGEWPESYKDVTKTTLEQLPDT